MNDEQAVRLLHSMVCIPSLSTEEARLARFLVSEMNHLGFDAFFDDAGNAVGTIGEGPHTVALVGHIDTVSGDLPVTLEDGVLTGRGTVDAKGPMAAFIAAAARYASSPDAKLRVKVVGCVEEEAPSSAGARFLVPDAAPDFLIVGEPSGWDGITLGYKGYMRAKIRMEDEATHTAHDVVTVAARMCDVWQKVRAAADRFNEGREKAFDRLLTALLNFSTDTDGMHDHAALDVSLRLPEDISPEEAEAWLNEVAHGCEVTVLGALPAWSGPRTTPLHRSISRAIRANGGEPIYKLKTGTADLNILAPAWACPAIAYGPGDAGLDHTPDEHIEIAEYLRGVAVLTDTLKNCAEQLAGAAKVG